MVRSVRWVVAVAAVVAAFGLCLWLARSVSFGWMPQGEADRWVVATAFATVVAGSVGVATGWWAGREGPPAPESRGRRVTQRAKVSDRGQAAQVGGNQNAPGGRATTGHDSGGVVEQDAEASGDARITQVGGDQNTTGQGS
ncbi:hypothetical protein [Streptomyces umbrinus]|uniref:hypothetical protein n=1 Tax=Streptomyces umbrinus TaxID=67370 RepID=UPI0033D0401B